MSSEAVGSDEAVDQELRLRSLAGYGVTDLQAERSLDAVAQSAALALSAPLAFLTIVGRDRVWHKAAFGADPQTLAAEQSLCTTVVAAGRPVVIPDLASSPEWRRHPQAALGIRAYAGMPVVGRDGLALGALCVADTSARDFSREQLDALGDLTEVAVELLELRRLDRQLLGDRAPGTTRVGPSPVRHRDVLRALEDGEFTVLYQPIVDLPDGRTTEVEALVRWDLPGTGLVGPQDFLPYIESSEVLSEALRDFVLDRALGDLASWRAAGAVDLRLSVNISGSAVRSGGLCEPVLDALRRHDVPPEALTLEITETSSLGDLPRAATELAAVRATGVRLALDDFGLGYNGLELIGLLPLDVLKLDRAFVEPVCTAGPMTVILRSTIALTQDLGLDVVAEGIEQEEQVLALVELGVQRGQGYHFARPLTAEQIGVRLGLAGVARAVPASRPAPAGASDSAARAAAVSTILRMHAEGASTHTIAAALNQRGLPRPGGLRWHSAVVGRIVCPW